MDDFMKNAIIGSALYCIIMAVLAGSALASVTTVDTISLQPFSPNTWDDVTCQATVSSSEGDLSMVRFTWFRNGVGIRTFDENVYGYYATVYDILGSSVTEEGDEITCRIEVRNMGGSLDSRSSTVIVRETSINHPPIIQGIPDRGLEIGDELQIDLWQYASDIEDEDSELSFGLTSQGNTDIISCYLSGNRFLYCGKAKQLGETDLTVRVTDSSGAWDTDTFSIKVIGDSPMHDNVAPEIDFVDIDPSNPDEREDLSCQASASDDDGNLDNMEFRWYVNGGLERTRIVMISGYQDTASDTLDSSNFNGGDDVECVVTAEDDEGQDDTGSASVGIADEPDDSECSISIRSLEVRDEDEIRFVIRNSGDLDADVDYRIYVDGDRIERDDIDVDEDDSDTIRFRYYDFEEGESYRIRVVADADCGTDYDDDESSVTYTLVGGDECSEAWLDSYRCSGNWVQRLFRNSDCYTSWQDWKHCTYGCSGGTCLSGSSPYPSPSPGTGCTLVIDSFEFSETVASGQSGFIEARVRSSDSRTQDVTMNVYLDGEFIGNKNFIVYPGIVEDKVWNFMVYGSGSHTVSVTFTSTCGASISRQGVINSGSGQSQGSCNYNGFCEYDEDFLSCPYDCEQPSPEEMEPTSVEITPSSLDVGLYKSKVITIDIHSFPSQDFLISVSGVPEGWLQYETKVSVDDDMFTYVFVNPKETGNRDLRVTVLAEDEGLYFTKDISLYAAPAEEPAGTDGVTGFLTAMATNIWVIIAVIIIAAVILVWYSQKHLREEEETTFPKQ